MDNVLQGALRGAIIGAVVGLGVGVVMLLIRLAMPAQKCPECGEALPKVRAPASGKQAAWGGQTCPKCGCEVDRKGRKREA